MTLPYAGNIVAESLAVCRVASSGSAAGETLHCSAVGARLSNAGIMDKLQALESTVESLIARCQQLAEDNRELRQQEADWQRERQRLVKNNEVARTRVEAMINRLKGLAQES